MASTLELLILAQIAEPAWTALSLINSWSNNGSSETSAQYRYLPLTNSLEVIGMVTHAAVTGTSQFCSTFTSFLPVSNQRGSARVLAGAATIPALAQLLYTTGGVLEFAGLPSGSTIVQFHEFLSLDA